MRELADLIAPQERGGNTIVVNAGLSYQKLHKDQCWFVSDCIVVHVIFKLTDSIDI